MTVVELKKTKRKELDMKSFLWIGVIVISVFMGVFILYHYNEKTKEEAITVIISELKQKMEFAYFEGQRDYSEGDIRIVKDGCVWHWSKSPWDGQDTSRTIFKPENERAEK